LIVHRSKSSVRMTAHMSGQEGSTGVAAFKK
jgi:hypothetical protein